MSELQSWLKIPGPRLSWRQCLRIQYPNQVLKTFPGAISDRKCRRIYMCSAINIVSHSQKFSICDGRDVLKKFLKSLNLHKDFPTLQCMTFQQLQDLPSTAMARPRAEKVSPSQLHQRRMMQSCPTSLMPFINIERMYCSDLAFSALQILCIGRKCRAFLPKLCHCLQCHPYSLQELPRV